MLVVVYYNVNKNMNSIVIYIPDLVLHFDLLNEFENIVRVHNEYVRHWTRWYSKMLLHSCKYSLSIPLCRLFNQSLITGTFPSQCKIGFITSI